MNDLIEIISQPWPWFVSGVMIAAIMVILLFFGKSFGFSSNLRTICAMAGAGKVESFFRFDWKQQSWNLLFLVGAIIGGVISSLWLGSSEPVAISAATVQDLSELGIVHGSGMNPMELFGPEALNAKGILLLLAGGLFVGFGTRWAGGCTSGHAISGISNLQIPSIIAVVGFFIGGLLMTHFLLPVLLR
jgi:uncharacterized membrane protein YedE/YeeE